VTRAADGTPTDTVSYVLGQSANGVVWVDAGPPKGRAVRLSGSAVEALLATLELHFPTAPAAETAAVALDSDHIHVGLDQSFSLGAVLVALAITVPVVGLGVAFVRARRRASTLSALSMHHLAGRESERLRLAREIYDGPVQDLHVVSHSLSSVPAIRDHVRSTADELRRIAAGLRPPALDRFGLLPALYDLGDQLEATPPHPRVLFDDDPSATALDLSPDQALALYRIVQEASHNAVTHGCAQTLLVSATATPSRVVVSIEDDGDGFDADHLDLTDLVREGHFGLAGMHERVRDLGGTLAITSLPRHTVVEARLPR
jgi:signal transduction histidine kinase